LHEQVGGVVPLDRGHGMSPRKNSPAATTRAALLPLAVLCAAIAWATPAAVNDEPAYLAESSASMARMMADMSIRPTGDIDRDFVAMMVPHHQGAIDMAQALLKYGTDERLKRLAQEIIVTQQEEIAVMRRIAVASAAANETKGPDR
jgi:Domain of unknown function (DUF305)